jgi:hypothetical protein
MWKTVTSLTVHPTHLLIHIQTDPHLAYPVLSNLTETGTHTFASSSLQQILLTELVYASLSFETVALQHHHHYYHHPPLLFVGEVMLFCGPFEDCK